MQIDLIASLRNSLDDQLFGHVAKLALEMVEHSSVQSQRVSEQRLSSFEIAKTHTLRQDIGYYKRDSVYGLSETIKSLNRREMSIYTAMLETNLGLVGFWFSDDEPLPVGIILAKYMGHSGEKRTSGDVPRSSAKHW